MPLREIRLDAPELRGREVHFRWEVDPPSALYRRGAFALAFPAAVDPARVPAPLWASVAILCLHTHWVFLRPCRVQLRFGLDPREVAFWGRLLDAHIATLETYRGSGRFEREIEILPSGAPPEPAAPLADAGRCATAFSGGKDSLVHAGLLCELTRDPLLVTTTSPLPPLRDHQGARRRRALAQIAQRRPLELVEVESDFRSAWDNDFARHLGFPVSVNEVTDAFLYTAALIGAGYARGASHLFLASENEVSEVAEVGGRLVQHPHFMYSALTQGALRALLAPHGLGYGSLTSALHAQQVQALLARRYRDLGDLQYSCWKARGDRSACSRCLQCLRLALTALSLGESPSRMGVDLARALDTFANWEPRARDAAAPRLPRESVSARLEAQLVRALRGAAPARALAEIARHHPERLCTPRGWRALRAWRRMRERADSLACGPAPGHRAGFLASADPLLRARLAAIFAEHFEEERADAYSADLARIAAAVDEIAAPLASCAGKPAEGGRAASRRRAESPD